MRLCLATNSRFEPGVHDVWFELIQQNLRKVLRPESVLELRCPERGLSGTCALDFDNAYYDALELGAIGEALVSAAREGFDAISVACFADPCVREVRNAVETPVIGAGETTILVASLIGRKLGIIATNMPEQVGPIEENVHRMGLRDRIIPGGIRLDTHDVADTFAYGFEDPGRVAQSVEDQARRLVQDGADAVVIGCCATGPFCTAAGLSSLSDRGRNIPVLDPVLVSAKFSETAADLRNGAGLPFTSFAVPSEEDVDRVHALFAQSDGR